MKFDYVQPNLPHNYSQWPLITPPYKNNKILSFLVTHGVQLVLIPYYIFLGAWPCPRLWLLTRVFYVNQPKKMDENLLSFL